VIDEHRTALLAEFARVGKALSAPSRLALLELLTQAERSVEDLAEAAGLAIGNTSAQLQVLRGTGLVETRRAGTRVYYRLAGDDIAALYTCLHQVARNRSAAVESIRAAYLSREGPVRPVTREELLRLTAAGEVIVLDVRPSVESSPAAAGPTASSPAGRCTSCAGTTCPPARSSWG
jgi:DNA-binding transcriptional ArsR family regulator